MRLSKTRQEPDDMPSKSMLLFAKWHLVVIFAIAAITCQVHAQDGGATPDIIKPDLVLRGTVTYADRQTYKEIPFTVPSGVTRVSVELSYTEHDKHTNIDLGVLDPERFRGWSGGNKNFFTISETDATPSYLPGVIPAGR
jgi:hypothetical protein